MAKYVIINGLPQSGKSTFEDFCVNHLGEYAVRYSTIDLPKLIYYNCGWNGVKTPEMRRKLSELKEALTNTNDLIWEWCEEQESNAKLKADHLGMDWNKVVIFVSAREPEAIQRFKDEKGAITVLLRRSAASHQNQSNDSDRNVEQFKYDFTYNNNGPLNELEYLAEEFCNYVQNKL